jgi:hypothetical protein
VTFASNQVRIRLPRDPHAAWSITQAVVAQLVAAAEAERGHGDPEDSTSGAMSEAVTAGRRS